MRPQRLSGRKERYSCGPASTCAAREVCVLCVQVLHVLESNCTHATLYKHQDKLYVAHSQIIIRTYFHYYTSSQAGFLVPAEFAQWQSEQVVFVNAASLGDSLFSSASCAS